MLNTNRPPPPEFSDFRNAVAFVGPFEALWRYNAEDDITLMRLRDLFSRQVICEDMILEGECREWRTGATSASSSSAARPT